MQLDNLSQKLTKFGDLISTGFKKVDSNFTSLTKEIKDIHNQIETVGKKLDALKGETTDGLEDVGLKLENLTEEIAKIETVTRYKEYANNLSAIKTAPRD